VSTHGERAVGLTLLTRAECELCEQMLHELTLLGRQHALPTVELRDVDGDPDLQRRYGLKIPVLLIDGALVCSGRLDPAELLRLLKS
jgi:predicted thioredoxin/glutaredoxin